MENLSRYSQIKYEDFFPSLDSDDEKIKLDEFNKNLRKLVEQVNINSEYCNNCKDDKCPGGICKMKNIYSDTPVTSNSPELPTISSSIPKKKKVKKAKKVKTDIPEVSPEENIFTKGFKKFV